MRYFILLLLSFSAAYGDSSLRYLTVNGEGKTVVQANIADVHVAIEVQKKTAQEIQSMLAEKQKSILEKLRELKVEQLEAGTIQITPVYSKEAPEILSGFKGLAVIQFSTEAKNAGLLIDEAIHAGANEVSSISLRPSSEIIRDARLKSLILASQRAQEEAQVVLKTLELESKAILEVSIESNPMPGPYYRGYGAAMLKSAAPSLEVTNQEQEVTARVQLKIQID